MIQELRTSILSPENWEVLRDMPFDKYPNFAALAAQEEDANYRIRLCDRGTRIVILAPHGGNIEPGTSEIASAIAAEKYSLYCFEGLRKKSKELHITSTNFGEPKGRKLVEASEIAIAIHGRADKGDNKQFGLVASTRDCVTPWAKN